MQLQLPMLTYYTGPKLVPLEVVAGVPTYREAVRLCWQMRLRTSLTRRALAEEAGLYASHVTDYLSAEHSKRELPARHIAAMEVACGNRVITQWLAMQANLTILETFIQPHQVAA
jgi:hypothetical protein